jgi:hypothetical protein
LFYSFGVFSIPVIVLFRYEDEESEELPNLKSRLISKIKLGLEEELSLLKDIL